MQLWTDPPFYQGSSQKCNAGPVRPADLLQVTYSAFVVYRAVSVEPIPYKSADGTPRTKHLFPLKWPRIVRLPEPFNA